MSASTSPTHYPEDAFTADANFKIQINQKMKVPDKISFNPNANGLVQGGYPRDNNVTMHVPERILVTGHHQHIGTTAPPREIVYDNSFIQNDPYPGIPRVATPPRSLTLDKYSYPGISEVEELEEIDKELDRNNMNMKVNLNDSDFSMLANDTLAMVGAGGDSLTSSQEVLHLRKQLAKLNRRVIDLEIDRINRVQKEKLILGVSFTYFLLKLLFWMSRD